MHENLSISCHNGKFAVHKVRRTLMLHPPLFFFPGGGRGRLGIGEGGAAKEAGADGGGVCLRSACGQENVLTA